jgi:Flp pilus assembly protein TadG
MLQRHFRNFTRKRERGVYIVFLGLTFLALLAIVGLAIDAAKLYRTKVELQSAVDAATVAGDHLLVTQPTMLFSEVRTRVAEVFKENLHSMKIDSSQIDDILANTAPQSFNVCFNDPNSSQACSADPTDTNAKRRYIQVIAAVTQPTLILGVIPGFTKSNLVVAQSLAENLKLQILLVVDVSGSMDDDFGTGANKKKKIDALHIAGTDLVNTLLGFDELGIVTFSVDMTGSDDTVAYTPNDEPLADANNWSRVLGNFLNDADNPLALTQVENTGPIDNRPLMKSKINALMPLQGTDTGAGLRMARKIFDSTPLPPKTIRIIVVATDGATNSGAPLTWFNVGDTRPAPFGIGVPDYGPGSTSSNDRPLNRPFLTPPRICNSPFLPITNMGRPNGLTLQRLRFLDTIIEADQARDSGNLIWAIGLGDPDLDNNSPFQNFGDDLLKLPLLTRIANDQEQMPLRSLATPQPTPRWVVPTPNPSYPWDFPCIRSGQTLKNDSKQKVGKFTLASDAAALSEAFKNIATIRIKVTQ